MRLTLHLTREQRIRLEQAAALGGQALNDFIVDSACASAEQVLRKAPARSLPEQYALGLDNPEPVAPARGAERAAAAAEKADAAGKAHQDTEPGRSLWDDA